MKPRSLCPPLSTYSPLLFAADLTTETLSFSHKVNLGTLPIEHKSLINPPIHLQNFPLDPTLAYESVAFFLLRPDCNFVHFRLTCRYPLVFFQVQVEFLSLSFPRSEFPAFFSGFSFRTPILLHFESCNGLPSPPLVPPDPPVADRNARLYRPDPPLFAVPSGSLDLEWDSTSDPSPLEPPRRHFSLFRFYLACIVLSHLSLQLSPLIHSLLACSIRHESPLLNCYRI